MKLIILIHRSTLGKSQSLAHNHWIASSMLRSLNLKLISKMVILGLTLMFPDILRL